MTRFVLFASTLMALLAWRMLSYTIPLGASVSGGDSAFAVAMLILSAASFAFAVASIEDD